MRPLGASVRLGHADAVDLVGARLERSGEAAERRIEHRAHQEPERTAFEFVGNIELDLAGGVVDRPEAPTVVEIAEWSVEILDADLESRSVERDPACEGLPDQLV